MSRVNPYVSLLAAGFGLVATAGSVWAQDDQHGQGAPELEPQHTEEQTEFQLPDIFTPEGGYATQVVPVPEGMMVIPGPFEPTIRFAVSCKDAPSSDVDNAYYSNAVGFVLSVSETDLAQLGAIPEMFFSEYGDLLNMALNSIHNQTVAQTSPEDVAEFSATYQQGFTAAATEFFAEFEQASGISVRADVVMLDRAPDGPACHGRPPRLSA